MAFINTVNIGKVTKIVDPESYSIRVDLVNQPEFGEDGILALPWGSITSRIEKDDTVIILQVGDRPGTFFYMPIKLTKGKIGIYHKDSFIDFTDPDKIVIQFQDKSYIICKGDLYVKVSGKAQIDVDGDISFNIKKSMKVNGPGQLELKGIVTPDSTNFALNAIPVCPYTGMNHGGCNMLLTNSSDAPQEAPDTKPPKDE